ncbi:LolA family protein [Dethiosulfatarculus sandiegensis]|nr:outer membrane lipoprotein carrier protein LolA [Dethiosulfatarculus sandiegensis]
MKKWVAFGAVLFLLFAPWAVNRALASGEPGDLAVEIQKRYQDIHGIKASYLRHSRFVATGSQLNREIKGAGVLYWSRPTNLRLEQKTPKEELIVATDQGVWWVRESRQRADLYPQEQFTSGLKPLLDALGGLAALDQDFNLEKPGQEHKGPDQQSLVLVLIPKHRRVDLKTLVLWFEPDSLLLKGFRITSLVGDVTEYLFQDLEVNPDFSGQVFSYDPPADFRVRDHHRK